MELNEPTLHPHTITICQVETRLLNLPLTNAGYPWNAPYTTIKLFSKRDFYCLSDIETTD